MDNSFTIKGYKCFKEKTYVEKPELVNLIIGKNNSGKSSLTDVFRDIYSIDFVSDTKLDSIDVDFIINESTIESAFSKSIYRGGYGYGSDSSQYEYGKRLVGRTLTISIKRKNDSYEITNVDLNQPTITEFNDKTHYSDTDWRNLARACVNSIKKKHFYKISAERDIGPEPEGDVLINTNGTGVTAKIDSLLTVDGNDYSIVSEKLLDAINYILEGEEHFLNITTVKDPKTQKKNICFGVNNNRIRLSDMGSGLKTIIFVLFMLITNQGDQSNTVFIFEELENNLHPEIQRRLFNYIYDYCIEHNCHAFLTSHSHVSINCFYGRDKTAIYHVYKTKVGSSTVEKIESYLEKTALLDDLGVKASDIFQANGIIWVEGPSDRVYINKWISLVDNSLKENIDFCYLYYGGKLLSHYTASETDELIRILLINRNGAIVMDSDLNSEEEQLRETKKRILSEFKEKKMFSWVTKGREIENYIHHKDLNKEFEVEEISQIKQFERFDEYIKDYDSCFSSHKVEFAKSLSMDETSLEVLDLRDKIELLIEEIKKWNKIK